MKTTTKELFMTFTKEEINSVNLRAGRFDMTQIPRLRTDFTEADGIPNYQALNALNERVNANSEAVEDLWIELDCQLIDAMEAEKKRKKGKRPNRGNVESKLEALHLHKTGYSIQEITSITGVEGSTVYKWVVQKDGLSDLFDACPEDIKADLFDADFDLQ